MYKEEQPHTARAVDDVLEMTARDAIVFFEEDDRIAAPLNLLAAVGLDYLFASSSMKEDFFADAGRVIAKRGRVFRHLPRRNTLANLTAFERGGPLFNEITVAILH